MQRTIEQVEHKWWDLKSASKKVITGWKKEMTKTGGGTNRAAQPSEIHHRIIDIIGQQSFYGIHGAASLESSIGRVKVHTTPLQPLQAVGTLLLVPYHPIVVGLRGSFHGEQRCDARSTQPFPIRRCRSTLCECSELLVS